MRLEHESIEQLRRDIRAIFVKHLNLGEYRVFFFGSRISGKGSDRSDIDIGIEGAKPVPPLVMAHIKDELADLPILYKIDVVDFHSVPPDFKRTALMNIEPL